MKIGELARRSGLSTSTIRFYESKGLLNAVSRLQNGYRSYPLEAVALLNIITNAQQTGFSLDEIRQVLPQDLSNWHHDALVAALHRKVADIEAMEVKLAQNKAQLMAVLHLIDTKPEDMACAENASRVLTTLGVPLPKASKLG
jgi:DNA-binding transcriptional MerR regulator